MKVFAGKKRKKGFVLLEVVLVVAILSIAMAITVPGLVRTARSLKITELDDIAREIYTAAQNQSVSLSVSGQLSQVGGVKKAVPLADGDPTETMEFTAISNKSGSTFCSSGVIDMLLPLGSIDETVRQNYYLIEYNPVTAAVKGVYYWENADNDFLNHYTGTADSRDERMNYSKGMVGYYGGADVKRLPPPTEGGSSVKAELFNDEELYLKITPGKDASGHRLEGTITITLTDLDKDVSKQIASFKNTNISGSGGRLTYESGGFFKLTLDSLKEGLRFSKLDEEFPVIHEGSDYTSFYPGCNLKVTVTFQEEGKQAKDAVFLTNSLYASVDGEYNKDDPASTDRTAYIACGRHLENLGVHFVYPDGKQLNGDSIVTFDPWNHVTKAVQTKDIDWHGSLGAIGADPTIVPFRPIVNDKLVSYNGQGNTISHMDIFDVPSASTPEDVLKGLVEKNDYGIGLFSRFKGNKIERVKLVDCTVKGLTVTAPQHVGLLAGKIDDSTCNVSDCHAYATKTPGTGSAFNCSIDVSDVSGAVNVGGLFGSVQNATVTKSFASLTKITGSTNVGGLAGQTTGNVTIDSCYADTGVWSSTGNTWVSGLTGSTAGGLVGSAGGPLTLKNSYAVGWISGGTNAYGLVGSVGSGSGGTIEKCYAAVTHGDKIAGLVPSALAAAAKSGGCINYGGAYASFDSLTDPFTKGGTPEQRAKTTHAYGMPAPAGGSPLYYPFPRLSAMPHYGDWPQEEAAMVYYEVYQNGSAYSIGFYNKDVPVFQSLEDSEDHTVVMDGYAVMLPTAAASATPTVEEVKYNGHTIGGTSDLKLLSASDKFDMDITNIGTNGNIKGTAYHPLFLNNAMMTENGSANKGSYYQKLEVTAGGLELNVWFNPYVAKSDFVEAEAAPAAPGTSILRSARQVTAYSYDAMQKTATGSGETTHTLRLERDISLAKNEKKFKTDSGYVDCVDLKISPASANVILELNGKILTGTGKDSVVTSGGGKLEIYGCTKAKQHEELKGKIIGSDSNGDTVSADGEITVVGCTIIP